jgi:hypothetical protein
MIRALLTVAVLWLAVFGLWWAADTTITAIERQINEGWNER